MVEEADKYNIDPKKHPQVGFRELKDFFLAKHTEGEVKNEPRKFIDASKADPEKEIVLLSSYARSGNAMCRDYFMRIMGVYPGGDMHIDIPAVKGLIDEGLLAESIT